MDVLEELQAAVLAAAKGQESATAGGGPTAAADAALGTSDLFGGLAGVAPDTLVEPFDLGHGIVVRPVCAQFMAPFLMTFGPAAPGQPNPGGPVRAAQGGLGFDVRAEVHVPADFALEGFFDRLNTVWWIASLIRLRGSSMLHIPVIADHSFATVATLGNEARLMPFEISPHRLSIDRRPRRKLDPRALEWVRKHWRAAGSLVLGDKAFHTAYQALDQCTWSHSMALALVGLWGAMERLFSQSTVELKFRISANIATFLEPPGERRLARFKQVQRLYEARSAAAHGNAPEEANAFFDTCGLMRRVITKIIEENRVPRRDELERQLFFAPRDTTSD